MSKPAIIFMGTPVFALPSLEALLRAGYCVVAVVTQPDRPWGRGQKPAAPAVKQLAVAYGLEVLQPAGFKDGSFWQRLEEKAPGLIVTVAYGRILPPRLLAYPALGCINLHASMLPAYRGAAPIQRAIMDGASQTGVTVLKMVAELDAGDIICQESEPIYRDDTAGALHDRLAVRGSRLLLEAIDALANETARAVRQDPAAVTYAGPLHPEEERIDWRRGSVSLYNHIRGLNPRPGAYAIFAGTRLKVLWAEPHTGSNHGQPGAVLRVEGESITVATGDGALKLLQLQPAGRRLMSAGSFASGYGVKAGCLFN